MTELIDPSYDFNFERPPSAHRWDADSDSDTLRRYHQHLWNKPLPSGGVLRVVDGTSDLPCASIPTRTVFGISELLRNCVTERIEVSSEPGSWAPTGDK